MGRLVNVSGTQGTSREALATWGAVAQVVAGLGYDVKVISWVRPTDTDSNHQRGAALDLRPAPYTTAQDTCGVGRGNLVGIARQRAGELASALRAAYPGSETIWGTCAFGGHQDHVHQGWDRGQKIAGGPVASGGSGPGISEGERRLRDMVVAAATVPTMGLGIAGALVAIGIITITILAYRRLK